MNSLEFYTQTAALEVRSVYRLHPADGHCEQVQVGVGHDGFIAYAAKLTNGEWEYCPEHPFVKQVVVQLGKPWFGEATL